MKPRQTEAAMSALTESQLETVTEDNWRNYSTKEVSGALSAIQYGHDDVAAENLIRYFHYADENGELFSTCSGLNQIDRDFLSFVSEAFAKYVDGKSIGSAFGLNRARGERESKSNLERDIVIAAAVEKTIRTERAIRGNVKKEPIYIAIGKEASLGWKSVEKIYAANCSTVSWLSNDELVDLADRIKCA